MFVGSVLFPESVLRFSAVPCSVLVGKGCAAVPPLAEWPAHENMSERGTFTGRGSWSVIRDVSSEDSTRISF